VKFNRAETERKIKVRQARSRLAKNLDKLEGERRYYLDKAKAARLKGETASYKLARSGLSATLTQAKRSREMLLNLDITAEMRDTGTATRDFLAGMDRIFRDISKLNKKINLRETRYALRNAMAGMENMQAGLDSLLVQTEESFGDLAEAGAVMSESELDRLIGRELSLDGEIGLDEMDAEIEADARARKGDAGADARARKGDAAPPVLRRKSGKPDEMSVFRIPIENLTAADSLKDLAKDAALDAARPPVGAGAAAPAPTEYRFPPLSLLDEGADNSAALAENSLAAERDAAEAEAALAELKVAARTAGVVTGPAYSRLLMAMPPGVSVSRVTPLLDDIAMRLKKRVRFEVPAPGQNAFGIEVENPVRETVRMREILDGEAFASAKKEGIVYAAGVDPDRRPILKNLADAPHLLIAGSSGSGKSCFIHAMLCSILYKYTPAEVKFALIDFKRVELTAYNGLPNLYGGAVIDNDADALALLGGLTDETERRYALLLENRCRQIGEYNARAAAADRLPYIAVFVDEYADISTGPSAKEYDTLMRGLAQKARAGGIHLVVATQRPSADILSGTVKNNFPAQAAFRVARKEDSRTVLAGQSGAELLLGKGDMLFNDPAGGIVRLQAPLVTMEEIERVTDYLKKG
jgi:DNA segregation ATPase FtsK/SpoIIIE-like protein